MFPIIGSLLGPGGRFVVESLVFDLLRTLRTIKKKMKEVNNIGKARNWFCSIFKVERRLMVEYPLLKSFTSSFMQFEFLKYDI